MYEYLECEIDCMVVRCKKPSAVDLKKNYITYIRIEIAAPASVEYYNESQKKWFPLDWA